ARHTVQADGATSSSAGYVGGAVGGPIVHHKNLVDQIAWTAPNNLANLAGLVVGRHDHQNFATLVHGLSSNKPAGCMAAFAATDAREYTAFRLKLHTARTDMAF